MIERLDQGQNRIATSIGIGAMLLAGITCADPLFPIMADIRSFPRKQPDADVEGLAPVVVAPVGR